LNGSNRTCEKSRSVRQVSKLACVPRQSRSARTTRIYKRRGETMLSDFPRLGFDPFAELRRMQSEMNRLFGGVTAATAREFPSVDAPFQARENVGVAVARGRMLSSVRPLMRQDDSRRPVWEFADWVQITHSVLEARWKPLVVPAPSRRLLRHTLL